MAFESRRCVAPTKQPFICRGDSQTFMIVRGQNELIEQFIPRHFYQIDLYCRHDSIYVRRIHSFRHAVLHGEHRRANVSWRLNQKGRSNCGLESIENYQSSIGMDAIALMAIRFDLKTASAGTQASCPGFLQAAACRSAVTADWSLPLSRGGSRKSFLLAGEGKKPTFTIASIGEGAFFILKICNRIRWKL